jgi:hypothetical protein
MRLENSQPRAFIRPLEFHGKLPGETSFAERPARQGSPVKHGNQPAVMVERASDRFETGFLLGVLVGEGHFGGDGRQPQVTLKLHVRHEALLRYIMSICPGGRLYGPYNHGGRHYYQLMYRGKALRDELLPLLDSAQWERIDPPSFARYADMKSRYPTFFAMPIT